MKFLSYTTMTQPCIQSFVVFCATITQQSFEKYSRCDDSKCQISDDSFPTKISPNHCSTGANIPPRVLSFSADQLVDAVCLFSVFDHRSSFFSFFLMDVYCHTKRREQRDPVLIKSFYFSYLLFALQFCCISR